jgi:phosphoesterase, MJ0936 family
MKVGILSDSHDHLTALGRAVEIFNDEKIEFVIHAGDFVAPFSLRALEELRCPWIGVFGNNDGEQQGLTQQSKGRIQLGPYHLSLDGKKVVVVHDLTDSMRAEIIHSGARIVISGHTHKPTIERAGEVLFINPGELCGWISGRRTVALLDSTSLEVSLIEVALE